MFITIANKTINCYYLSTFFFKDNTDDNITTYQIIYMLVNGRKYIEEFSSEEDRLTRYNEIVANLTACGMFILISTVPQNVVQIASLDKEDTIIDDTPVYKVIYRIQNGDNLEESFNSSSDRNTRFDEVSSIRIGSLGGLKVEVVDELPPIEDAETGILYLVPKEGSGNDVYDEYIVVEIDDQRSYEFLGTTAVDLSDYYTKEETDTLLGNKQDTLVSGTNIKTINNESILGSGNINIPIGDSYIIKGTDFGKTISNYNTTENRTVFKEIYDNYEKITEKNVYYLDTTYDRYIQCSGIRLSGTQLRLYIDYTSLSQTNYYGVSYQPKTTVQLYGDYSNGGFSSIDKYDLSNFGLVDTNSILGMSNTTPYTPSGDYNPATKKYVDDTVNASLTNIAPAYSSSNTYSVGDYVVYSGNLYVCNTDITIAEAWTSAHWTQTTVAEILGNINTLLGGI